MHLRLGAKARGPPHPARRESGSQRTIGCRQVKGEQCERQASGEAALLKRPLFTRRSVFIFTSIRPAAAERRGTNMPVKHIDSKQLQDFSKQYMEAPEQYLLGIEAKTIWEGQGLGNLGKIGPWSLGGKQVSKPTRDFSVQLGSWQEVGEAIGVDRASDRIEPVEAALTGLCACVSEAITVNCARTNVKLDGLEVSAHLEVDPGPI